VAHNPAGDEETALPASVHIQLRHSVNPEDALLPGLARIQIETLAKVAKAAAQAYPRRNPLLANTFARMDGVTK
jgi:hypothetical protein